MSDESSQIVEISSDITVTPQADTIIIDSQSEGFIILSIEEMTALQAFLTEFLKDK